MSKEAKCQEMVELYIATPADPNVSAILIDTCLCKELQIVQYICSVAFFRLLPFVVLQNPFLTVLISYLEKVEGHYEGVCELLYFMHFYSHDSAIIIPLTK